MTAEFGSRESLTHLVGIATRRKRTKWCVDTGNGDVLGDSRILK